MIPNSPSASEETSTTSLLASRYSYQLQRDLRNGRLETFSEALISLIARVVYFFSWRRLRLRAWGVTVFLFFLLWVATTCIALAWNSTMSQGSEFAHLAVIVHAWGALVAVLQLRSSRFFARLLLETLAGAVVGNLSRIEDLRDLSAWLNQTYQKKRQFIFCTFVSIALTLASVTGLYVMDQSALVNPGTILLSIFGWFLGATGWYFFVPAVTLSARLTRYKLDLFDIDPANSNLISSICSMMHAALFIAAAISTVFTSGVFLLFKQDDLTAQIVFATICGWGPLVFTMLYYQYALFTVIRRTKIAAAIPVQAAATELQQRIQHLDGVQLDKLNKLLDLHKRMLATNTTALDWRGAFTTVNTLLLPLASFLAARLAN